MHSEPRRISGPARHREPELIQARQEGGNPIQQGERIPPPRSFEWGLQGASIEGLSLINQQFLQKGLMEVELVFSLVKND